jgi:hypothetical protein
LGGDSSLLSRVDDPAAVSAPWDLASAARMDFVPGISDDVGTMARSVSIAEADV